MLNKNSSFFELLIKLINKIQKGCATLKNKLLLVVVVIMVLTTLVGCSKPPQTATVDDVPPQPKVFTSVIPADPASLNPITARGYFMPQALLVSPLIVRNPSGEYLPNVAESFTVSDDGLTYSLGFNSEMKFANGRTVTREDILGSFEYIKNHGTYGSIFSIIDSIEFEEWTLKIKLNLVSPAFTNYLSMSYFGILDMDLAKSMSVEEFNLKPSAYGLYALEEYSQGLRVVMNRNPHYKYFNPLVKNQGPAHLDTVIFRIISDPFTIANEYLQGNINYIPYADVQLVKAVEGKPEYRLLENSEMGTLYLILNNQKPPFNDVRVRLALAKAIDRNAFVQLLEGNAFEQYSLLIPGMTGQTEAADRYNKDRIGYDLAGAKALLKSLGYEDTNGDGILEKDGENLTITLLSTREEEQLVLFQALAAKAGFEVVLDRSSGAAFSAAMNEGRWDMSYNRIRTVEPFPFYNMLRDTGKLSVEMLAEWKQANEISDFSERVILYQIGQKKIIGDNAYCIPVFSYRRYEALSAGVTGEGDIGAGWSLGGFYEDIDFVTNK